MSMSYIVRSEESVLAARTPSLKDAVGLVYRAGDVLLALRLFIGEHPAFETDEDLYRVFALERFGEVPYTIRAVDLLSARGHYPASMALVRGLFESFVQLRYFAKYPDLLRSHLVGTSANERVQFKTMFEEFSPGFYRQVYRFLSSITHSGIALSALLLEPPVAGQFGKSRGRDGCEFNGRNAAVLIHVTAAVLRGFIEHFSTFFPARPVPTELAADCSELIQALDKFIEVMAAEPRALLAALTAR
jgi:hypothetical protein